MGNVKIWDVFEKTKSPKDPRMCSVKWCVKPRAGRRTYCALCQARMYKILHPERYFYNHLKQGATRRKLEFSLSFQEFKDLIAQNGIELGSRSSAGKGPSVDRIDPAQGYHVWNVRVLPGDANAAKGNVEKNGYVPAMDDDGLEEPLPDDQPF